MVPDDAVDIEDDSALLTGEVGTELVPVGAVSGTEDDSDAEVRVAELEVAREEYGGYP